MLHRLLVLIIVLSPMIALSAESPLSGVWAGTIGKKTVVVCFNQAFPSGSYYNKTDLKPINLTLETAHKWHEENFEFGEWALNTPINGKLTGAWRAFQGTKSSLPIHLTLIDGLDDTHACARDSYHSALEKTPTVTLGEKIAFSETRSYQKIQFAGQETIRLYSTDPAINKINAQLKLDKSKTAIQAYFQQRREFLGRSGYPTVDEHIATPIYWDDHFITIDFYEHTAGYGRNGMLNIHRTWNTKTGEEVDLWTWIGASANAPKIPVGLMALMRKKVEEQAIADTEAECGDHYQGKDDYAITLDKKGLHFDEEAWGNGCELSLFIPYQQLLPFLTEQGKKAVQNMISTQ